MDEKQETRYLIPANTKSGALILGIFKPFDLILLGVGVSITLIMLFLLPTSTLPMVILVLSPGVICAFLVLPIPNYHNVLTIITSVINFFKERRKFIWKGWCMYVDESKKK